jgi:hypothetical protein
MAGIAAAVAVFLAAGARCPVFMSATPLAGEASGAGALLRDVRAGSAPVWVKSGSLGERGTLAAVSEDAVLSRFAMPAAPARIRGMVPPAGSK